MQNRNLAIDTYRGLTIAFMIIVNTPGTWSSVYPSLLHADWHGCTATDLVFPSFLFIVGASMWFAYARYDRTLSPPVTKKLLRRTALIFLIGVLLNWFPFVGTPLSELRIMGVLQRIALGFGLGSFLCLAFSRKWVIRISVFILLAYWAILYYFGIQDANPYGIEGNAVRRLDLFLLGENHLWDGKGIPFDPEGILSSIPAAVTVVLGWLSGNILTFDKVEPGRAVFKLLAYGTLCITLGLFWSMSFPINKSLWTSSYVLYTGGLSMFLLGAMTWFYDMRKGRLGVNFLSVFGKNSLFAYVLSAILAKILFLIPWQSPNGTSNGYDWLYTNVFAKIDAGNLGSFLFALAITLVCWFFCWLLYRKKVFIKI